MNFCLVNSSKVEFWNFAIPSASKDLVDELHENPVVVAVILLEELCDLVRLELQGIREKNFLTIFSDNRSSLFIQHSPNQCIRAFTLLSDPLFNRPPSLIDHSFRLSD